jgi:hypothetical protein
MNLHPMKIQAWIVWMVIVMRMKGKMRRTAMCSSLFEDRR